MARYIDVEKFADEICNFPAIDEHSANAVILLLRRQPTADVAEVQHGHWIEDAGSYDLRDNFYYCSECHRIINLICGASLSEYPYCHCGAKMDGRSEQNALGRSIEDKAELDSRASEE